MLKELPLILNFTEMCATWGELGFDINESFSFHFSGSKTEPNPSVLSGITASFSHEGSCLLSSVFQGEEG